MKWVVCGIVYKWKKCLDKTKIKSAGIKRAKIGARHWKKCIFLTVTKIMPTHFQKMKETIPKKCIGGWKNINFIF